MFKQDRRFKRWEGGFMQRRAGSSPRIRRREFLSTYNMRGDDDALNVCIHTLLGNLMLKYSTPLHSLCYIYLCVG